MQFSMHSFLRLSVHGGPELIDQIPPVHARRVRRGQSFRLIRLGTAQIGI